MSIHLDPVIQEKLTAFANRRRRLIVTRGVFAALAMLLLTMLIIAGIDLSVRMPDWLRWTLSGSAYAAVLVIAWRQWGHSISTWTSVWSHTRHRVSAIAGSIGFGIAAL